MNNRYAIAGFAILSIFPIQVAAQSMTSVIGMYAGGLQATGGDNNIDESVEAYGVEGAFSYRLSSGISGQIDVNFENTGDIDGEGPRDFSQYGLRLGYDAGAYYIGAFGLAQEGAQLDEGRGTRTIYGAEAIYSSGSYSVFVQGGVSDYVDGDDDHGEMIDAAFLRGGFRYYLSNGGALTLEYMSVRAENNTGSNNDPINLTATTVSYEQQFGAARNWSWYGTASMLDMDDDSHNERPISETVYTAGVKYTFGGGSLQDRDNSYVWAGMPLDMRGHAYVDGSYAH